MALKNTKSQGGSSRFAKIVRTITIPPVMALVTLCLLFWLQPEIFKAAPAFLFAVVFLSVLPAAGYPLQPLIPFYRNKGRDGQRNLAIVMAVIGYIGSIVHAVAGSVSAGLWIIYISYLISGIGILVTNRFLKIRASGHACGVAGPVALLVYFLGPAALAGTVVLALVYYTSRKMQRHTIFQLIAGTCIPVVSVSLAVFLFGFV